MEGAYFVIRTRETETADDIFIFVGEAKAPSTLSCKPPERQTGNSGLPFCGAFNNAESATKARFWQSILHDHCQTNREAL